jgi:hypothetical protein
MKYRARELVRLVAIFAALIASVVVAAAAEVRARAILYEEDLTNPIGNRLVGTATWSLTSDGQGSASPVVSVAVQMPGRPGLHLTFRKNSDNTVPASHLITINFSDLALAPGGGVTSVPGILAKSGEAKRGVPLTGLIVKVTPASFMIGLSKRKVDVQRNIGLLLNQEWFDIPIVYSNKHRAIVAIEKGEAGDRFFTRAFSSSAGVQAPKKNTLASSGTGFVVSNAGQVLTNAHVVRDCSEIHVHNFNAVSRARVLAHDNSNDLALLATEIRTEHIPKWRLASRQGEEVVVFGFPLAGILASGGNATTGNITALTGLQDDSRFVQISAPIQPGNSGGLSLTKRVK